LSHSIFSHASHFYNEYYDSYTDSWKAYPNQLNINLAIASGIKFYHHILKPPVILSGYLTRWMSEGIPLGKMKYIQQLTLEEIKSMYVEGVPTQTMHQWLFYS